MSRWMIVLQLYNFKNDRKIHRYAIIGAAWAAIRMNMVHNIPDCLYLLSVDITNTYQCHQC